MRPDELFAQVDRTMGGGSDFVSLPTSVVRELTRYARAGRQILTEWDRLGEAGVLAEDDGIVCIDGEWWDTLTRTVLALRTDEEVAAGVGT